MTAEHASSAREVRAQVTVRRSQLEVMSAKAIVIAIRRRAMRNSRPISSLSASGFMARIDPRISFAHSSGPCSQSCRKYAGSRTAHLPRNGLAPKMQANIAFPLGVDGSDSANVRSGPGVSRLTASAHCRRPSSTRSGFPVFGQFWGDRRLLVTAHVLHRASPRMIENRPRVRVANGTKRPLFYQGLAGILPERA